ncbi:MAG: amidase [Actinobacteria bacterium]|nr:amidase [Actinomycetota bacterium]
MDPVDLAFCGIKRQAELLRDGETTATALTELYLERIARLNPRLNAFNAVFEDPARADAKTAQRKLDEGVRAPLLGVPVAIKDVTDVAGTVTGKGSGGFNEPAAGDSEIVRRLREAGAVVIGKTTLPEFAMFAHFCSSPEWGVTRNPWSLDRSPGASSGGSAAAVAAGMVGAAMASDGGGSIRVPAAHCGLFGLKPQRGRVSLMPEAQAWSGLISFGCVTRSVADSALFLDVVAGAAEGDAQRVPPPARPFAEAAASKPGRLRIGVSLKPAIPGTPVNRHVKDAVRRTAALLREHGHLVEDVKIDYPLLLPLFMPRYLAGVADDADGADVNKLAKRTQTALRLGRSRAIHRLQGRSIDSEAKVRDRIAPVFDRYDVLLTPTIARPIGRADAWRDSSFVATLPVGANHIAFTAFWNYTGQPAASVPSGFGREGLPLAVQLIGRDNDEDTLLSLAAQIEIARPWAGRRPVIALDD